ncbi:FAD-binding oxidoreductase [Rhizobium leguminosarum]|uniref:FAD-binding oxidoreductase n=1 Tax=Rhizobium leguminosarum TaxID=384 RepID=UPI0015586DF4|nr:FAD-binding oxidoreductase [Rhizobium leguminosarum]
MPDRLLAELSRHVSGTVLTGDDAAGSLRTGLWNGTGNTRTLAAVQCLSENDVQIAVQIASDRHVSVSALGGGHDWTARSVCRDGITLDLRRLNRAHADRQGATMTIEGGAIVQNVLDQLPDDMAFVAGVHSQVGVAGLTLGGGYGKLNSRFGLATDNLTRARVVLADGTIVDASPDEYSDLFWALRGAGKNFAILVSAEFNLFPLDEVLESVRFILNHTLHV